MADISFTDILTDIKNVNKTSESKLLSKLKSDRKLNSDPEVRRQKTNLNRINKGIREELFLKNNPSFVEDIKNNLYREEKGKLVRRYQPLKSVGEIYKKYGITESMGKEYSSAVKKKLTTDGLSGRASKSQGSQVRKNKKDIGKKFTGVDANKINIELTKTIKSENIKLKNLLTENPKQLIKNIRQNNNLVSQLQSVFNSKDGKIKNFRITDDEIKKLVRNGLFSEEHKTQVSTGKKNIEFPTNKAIVTKQANSKVLAPMNRWLNTGNNFNKQDTKTLDIKKWLTKNKLRTKVEGEKLYFGDDSIKKISARESYKKQYNLLNPNLKEKKTLQIFSKIAKPVGKVFKPLGIATGAMAVNTALKAGEKNPLDLASAYITANPQIATDTRRMRQEPKFRKQQIAELPQIMPEGFEEIEDQEDFTSYFNGGIVSLKGVK